MSVSDCAPLQGWTWTELRGGASGRQVLPFKQEDILVHTRMNCFVLAYGQLSWSFSWIWPTCSGCFSLAVHLSVFSPPIHWSRHLHLASVKAAWVSWQVNVFFPRMICLSLVKFYSLPLPLTHSPPVFTYQGIQVITHWQQISQKKHKISKYNIFPYWNSNFVYLKGSMASICGCQPWEAESGIPVHSLWVDSYWILKLFYSCLLLGCMITFELYFSHGLIFASITVTKLV